MGRGGGALSPSTDGSHQIRPDTSEVTAIHVVSLIFVQLAYAGYHVISKVALGEGVDRFVFSAYRDLIAVGALYIFEGVFSVVKKRHKSGIVTVDAVNPVCHPGKPKLSLAPRPPWRSLFFLSLTGVFLNQLFFLQGLARVSPVIAGALQLCIPVFTWVIAVAVTKTESISIGTKSGRLKLTGVLLCVIGALVVSFVKIGVAARGWADDVITNDDGGGDVGAFSHRNDPKTDTQQLETERTLERKHVVGVLFLLGNCTCMALYLTAQRKVLSKFPFPRDVTRWTYVMGSVLMTLGALVEVPPMGWLQKGVLQDSNPWVLTRSEIYGVLYGGIVASGFNYTIMTWVNQEIGPGVVSMFLPLQPAFGASLSFLVLGESVFWGTILGGFVISLGLGSVTAGRAVDAQRSHQSNRSQKSWNQELIHRDQTGIATGGVSGQSGGGALLRTGSVERLR